MPSPLKKGKNYKKKEIRDEENKRNILGELAVLPKYNRNNRTPI